MPDTNKDFDTTNYNNSHKKTTNNNNNNNNIALFNFIAGRESALPNLRCLTQTKTLTTATLTTKLTTATTKR